MPTMLARVVLTTVSLASFSPVVAAADSSNASWEGTWTGVLYNMPVSVSISDGKVVGYTFQGASYDVQYSKVTPTTVSFGDRDHYAVKLIKTGQATASEMVHGRSGYRKASLTRQ
jgi:hypothetical protein